MSLKIAIQMDPVEEINIDADSTFALAMEAQARGHGIYYYLPEQLSYLNGKVTAVARSLELRRERGNHFSAGEPELLDLAEVDVVLMRQDPPFDMAYITATHVLEHVMDRTLVINDPVEVRNAPEKLFVTHFADFMPPTLISYDVEAISAFREEHGEIIVKPLFGSGGAGVFHLKPEDDNLNSLVDVLMEGAREPVMAQLYLPEIRQGDKRVILVDGEPAGALNRVPAVREARSNLHVGGRAEKAEVDDRDREICAAIGPELARRGMVFVGIDVIGGYLTEINVTSPTGIQEIDKFNKSNISSLIWDAIERRHGKIAGS